MGGSKGSRRGVLFDSDAFYEARKEAGLTVAMIAQRAGIDPSVTFRIQRNGRGDLKLVALLWQIVTDRSRRVPVIDVNDVSCVVGEIRKSLIHTWNLPHRTVIVVVRSGESTLLCCQRHEQMRAGGRIDSFGEHERVEDEGDPEKTARRVVEDEIRVRGRKGDLSSDLDLNLAFRRIGGAYALQPYTIKDGAADPKNSFEWSTLFGLDVAALRRRTAPESIQAFDETDEGDEKKLRTTAWSIDDLLRVYKSNSEGIADGLAKVLRELTTRGELGASIGSFLRSGHPE